MPSGRDGLLAQIQAGKKLKKAEEQASAPAAPAGGGRDGLLAQIQAGRKLKHVEATEQAESKPKPAAGNDLAATLANAMANRRNAQESDSSEESDWDDD